jgi:hypothetical protein
MPEVREEPMQRRKFMIGRSIGIRIPLAAALLLLGGCAAVAVGDAVVGVGAAAVSVAATTVKVGAKAVGAVVDAVTPDGSEKAKK